MSSRSIQRRVALRVHERGHYLKQLGLRAWFARKRLTGAKPSPQFQLAPETCSEDEISLAVKDLLPAQVSGSASSYYVQASVPSIPEASDSVYNSAQSTEVLLKEFSPEASVVPQLPKTSLNDALSSSESVRSQPMDAEILAPWQFFARTYRLQNTLVVCESDVQQPFALEQRLLKNILCTFMGKITTPDMLGCFSWPVFHDTTLPGLEREQGVQLFSKWLAQWSTPEIEHVLFLGADKVLRNELKAMPLKRLDCFSVSLSDCLIDSSKKRVLWSEIKAAPQLMQSSK
jgi:hypothetical protein